MIFGGKIKKIYICHIRERKREHSESKVILFNFSIYLYVERTRGTKKLKVFSTQFASERPKSRSRFFERDRNRWGVEKFLRSKPKIKISAQRSERDQREPQRKQSNKIKFGESN